MHPNPSLKSKKWILGKNIFSVFLLIYLSNFHFSVPRKVQFLAEENSGPIGRPRAGPAPLPTVQGQDDRFFGPFEVFQPGNAIGPGPGGPDLRAFPAIPSGGEPGGPLPGADPAFGPFQVVDL